ncbi:MAG: B12-binding domain-containing radical SAM protein [Nanoarchaeota archaeon]|nr:B12-binding domain-containing radical SAM protein [Nanoarchaeota archaeon]
MKLALIHPRYNRGGAEPLGLLYLASVLREKGYKDPEEFAYFEGSYAHSPDVTIEQLKEYKPDILCFTLQTIYIDDCKKIATWFKKENPIGIVVAGGPHATILPKETLEEFADIVIIGEGEITLPEMLENLNNLEVVKGCAFKKDDQVIINPPRDTIHDLDSIPFPARDLLDQRYFDIGQLTINGSRGCPFSCTYCQDTLNQIFGMKFRQRSPKNVVNEIETAKELFRSRGSRVTNFVFTDDGITYRREWMRGVAQELIAQGNTLHWMGDTRADTVPDDDTLRLLRRAGCMKMAVGVESGNDYIRNEIFRKGVSREKIVDAFKRLRAADIQPHAFLMVGSPGETMESIFDTLYLLDEIKPASAQVSVTTPLPGTGLYDLAQEQNILKASHYKDFDYYYESNIELENFTKEEIERVRNAVKYAVVMRNFFKNYFNKEMKYSSLFRFFLNRSVNQFMKDMERGRSANFRRAVQRRIGIQLQKL